jgi:hypothetical protein
MTHPSRKRRRVDRTRHGATGGQVGAIGGPVFYGVKPPPLGGRAGACMVHRPRVRFSRMQDVSRRDTLHSNWKGSLEKLGKDTHVSAFRMTLTSCALHHARTCQGIPLGVSYSSTMCPVMRLCILLWRGELSVLLKFHSFVPSGRS